MSDRHKNHVEHELQAWLDGEIGKADRERIEEHLDRCERCAETAGAMKEILRSLTVDGDIPLHRSMWPGIHERLSRSPGPRIGFGFGLGASAVATAGLLIGILIGGGGAPPPANTNSDLLSAGSYFEYDEATTLDEIYLFTSGNGDES